MIRHERARAAPSKPHHAEAPLSRALNQRGFPMKRSVQFSYRHHVGTLTVSADAKSPTDFALAAKRKLEGLFGPLRFESCDGDRRYD